MTDEERREAELLAQEKFPDVPGMNHLGTREVWKAGYAAGRESMRSELERQIKINSEDEHYRHKYLAQLEAERARSAKLVEALRYYATARTDIEVLEGYSENGDKITLGARARAAIAEYEVSRD